ncbi:RNA-binding protein [Candidatus Woesearchaeota archaeon]|jgi:RNA-binding protein|nr:RNA-binding protein [Candidatus Woesearchaeota archaeon]MBT4596217.1 RNA-binding protein [Candidatus Woesearchaeota archaeon]MBT5741560.1 RNA-binding protein [Candidatus Woesearchaeota archaeon]MBT7849354.1 RNA-binding protein [Candidatus Woesearchaeota archaeon]MBT7962959.1 RNA-binding protein [Candidatus Woesearchaeota archaeon]
MFNLDDIKKTAHNLKPILHIGKKGITRPLIDEIRSLINKKKLIKIKLNKSISSLRDRKELANEIVSKCDCILINVIGNNIVLLSKGKNGN